MGQSGAVEEEKEELNKVKSKGEVKENGDRRKSITTAEPVDERTIRLMGQEEAVNCRDSNAPDLQATTASSTLPPVETSAVGLLQQRVRRASFEDQRPLPTKTNYELRRCKSEVAQPSDLTNPGHDGGNPAATAQNALTSKDKIQVANIVFLFFLKYHQMTLEFSKASLLILL